MMNFTRPPPTFLHDVILFAVFFFQVVPNRRSFVHKCYRTLASFSDPLQDTHCLFLGSVTGDSLPISQIHYRRIVAWFLDPLQETRCLFLGSVIGNCCLFLGSLLSDNFSLISFFRAERWLKQNFQLVCMMFRKVISFK